MPQLMLVLDKREEGTRSLRRLIEFEENGEIAHVFLELEKVCLHL
jgi:hypothetical protein